MSPASGRAPEPGATVVEYVVVDGRREVGRRTVRVEGGAVVEVVEAGEAGDGPAGPAGPAVTFTLSVADADAVRHGDLDLSVAFMRGQMKTAGDPGAVLRVLPVLSRAPHLDDARHV